MQAKSFFTCGEPCAGRAQAHERAQVSIPRSKASGNISSDSEVAARLPAQAIAAWQQHRVARLLPYVAEVLRGHDLPVHGLDDTSCQGAPNLLASKDLQLWRTVGTIFQVPAQRRVSDSKLTASRRTHPMMLRRRCSCEAAPSFSEFFTSRTITQLLATTTPSTSSNPPFPSGM